MSPVSSGSDHEEAPSLLALSRRGETRNSPHSVASDDSEAEASTLEMVAPLPQGAEEPPPMEVAVPGPGDGNIVVSTTAPRDNPVEVRDDADEDEEVRKMRRRLRELIRLVAIADDAAQRSKLRWVDGAWPPRPSMES